ncbi:dihydrolipoyl dehydrogenase [Desulfobacula sp.]|uniref:dihydrolipoyl dehydrogenase n=1 Tax=Desulfobacula sp. TaxID=2593537 RepID=UPI00263583D7|nr:dihydrolipoyl dehydrogenase [Desulfobacula sp.]
MEQKIIIIGGGPGGYVAAIRAAALGGKVTLIEKEHLGGTCLNWGCIPSKIMKHSADVFLKLSKANELGIEISGTITANMTALMARKNKIIATQRKAIAGLLKTHMIDVEMGRATIVAPGLVAVEKQGQDDTLFEYDKLIIATGTQPLNVPDFPFDHESIFSSNDILALNTIPESMVIVGGGVIGCEFAFIFAALGCKVTVVEAMSRMLPLPSVDADISKLLQREMKKHKINVLCDTVVTSCDKQENDLIIHLGVSAFTNNPKPKKIKTNFIAANKMTVCIGRSPLSADLGLDRIGIETKGQGWVEVNNRLETSVDGVYAIGDILGPEKVMLAHVASHEGIVAAENAMGHSEIMDYSVIPSAIFTMPEIGTVGLSEAEAIEKGVSVESFIMNFRALGKAQAINEIAGMAKMIVEKDTQKVLGVHLIGPHATDLIAEATLAIRHGMTSRQIAHTIHAHPTLAEILGELSLTASGKAIHG